MGYVTEATAIAADTGVCRHDECAEVGDQLRRAHGRDSRRTAASQSSDDGNDRCRGDRCGSGGLVFPRRPRGRRLTWRSTMAKQDPRSARDAAGIGPYARERERLVPLGKMKGWNVTDGEADIRSWEVKTLSGKVLGNVRER